MIKTERTGRILERGGVPLREDMTMHPTSFNFPSDAKKRWKPWSGSPSDTGMKGTTSSYIRESIRFPERIRGFEPDLIATRGNEGVVVGVKEDRGDVSQVTLALPNWPRS